MIDVGAAAQIRAELVALRDAGCALLVISEELDELFEISDRMHVIAKGRVSPSIKTADASTALAEAAAARDKVAAAAEGEQAARAWVANARRASRGCARNCCCQRGSRVCARNCW